MVGLAGCFALGCSDAAPLSSNGPRRPATGNGATDEDPLDDGGAPPSRPTDAGASSRPNGSRDGGTSSPGDEDAASPPADGGATSTQGTGGSGGPAGETALKAANGLAYIVHSPTVGAASDPPRGLLVLLHGSSASNYQNFVKNMATVAAKYNLIRASVLAPNGAGWNEGNQTQSAAALHAVVQNDLFKKYNIDPTKVFFSGQSSGGGFLSSHFVPLYGPEYRGGAFFQCGAAKPAVTFAPSDTMRRTFRIHMEITTGDTIWPQSFAQAYAAYTGAGMAVTKDDTKPGGHCQFDQQQIILNRMDAFLASPASAP
jgi:predicted esterase